MQKDNLKNETPTDANNVLADSAFVIMHKGAVNKNIFFSNVEHARNWIKFNYPKRRFKEPQENVFVCLNYGTTFKIVEIRHFR